MLVGGVRVLRSRLRYGLGVTGMSDHVSWGLYISNFTFLVGLAAAAMMLVLPAYVLHDVDFGRAVLIAEAVAVAALVMCLGVRGGRHRQSAGSGGASCRSSDC